MLRHGTARLGQSRRSQANYERAVGRTLEVNRVTIADAKSGEAERETLIPGPCTAKL